MTYILGVIYPYLTSAVKGIFWIEEFYLIAIPNHSEFALHDHESRKFKLLK